MTPEYRRWRAIGVIAAVLVMLTGVGQVWRALAQQDRSEGYRYSRITALDLDLEDADAQIKPSNDGYVEVHQSTRWTVSEPVINRETVDGRLRIRVRCPSVFPVGAPNCRATLTIGVPPGTRLEVRGTSTDTSVTGLTGDLSLHGTSGTFTLSGDSGRVTAQLTSGMLTGQGITSPQVQAQVTSGVVDLTFAAPPETLALAAGSGSVRAYLPQGSTYRVAASVGSGDTSIAPHLENVSAQRSISASADSGEVTLQYATG